MHRRALVALAALVIAAGPALAQEAAVPDRRVVTTTGHDFYGSDIGSIFDTTFKACREACLGNPACKALTFNSRSNACFLKSGVERLEPFAGAISARMVETTEEVRRRAAERVRDLGFLPRAQIRAARALAATIGGQVAADDITADAAMAAGAADEAAANLPLAARRYAIAATVGDGSAAWRALARVQLEIKGENHGDTRRLRREALAAAVNAYLRTEDDRARTAALGTLADALEANDQGRRMIAALRLAADLGEDEATEQKLAYALERYGFRVTGHSVDSDAADARICVQFSERLAEAGVDYAPYVKIAGGDRLPVEARDQQLCIDGVARGERYEVVLRAGLPSEDGEELVRPARVEAYIRDRSPSVRFVGRAYVLPRSADAAIPIVSVNLATVEIAIHRIGERNLLPAVQDDLFDQAIAKWGEQRIAEGRGERVWTGTAEVSGPVNADVTTALPIGEAISAFEPGVYAMTARVPGADEWERAATQWFIVTDLGLSALTGADGLHAFVRALSTAGPVEGAEVRLLARNNEVLGTATADDQGYARFAPGLTRGTGGMAPAMLTVATGSDFAFLDLSRPGFDLSDRGVEGRPAPGPVDVFATTERGVYRAGEVVHMTALARDGRADAIADLPLTLVVTRPDGVEYHRTLLPDQGAGGRAHSMRLGGGVPRGTWSMKLHTDPEAAPVAQHAFLVEDFVPERIDFDLDLPEGMLPPARPVTIALNARYLYGAPGAGLSVGGEIRVAGADGLPGFPGFRFGLADERVNAVSSALPSLTTDGDGDARFEVSIPTSEAATRPLQVTTIVHVTDSSGRPVERTETRPLAPAGIRIGLRPLFDGQAEEGGLARFEVVAVGPEGTQVPLDPVNWTLSRIQHDWVWYRLDGRWNYEAVTSRERVANGTIRLGAEGRTLIETPVEWGRYELRLASTGSARTASSHVFNAGWYTGGATTDTPDVLEIGLDREAYRIGDTVTVRLKPRTAGKVLINVVDNRLIESHALDVAAGETTFDLTVTEDWGPGAYVTASLIRPMDVAAKQNPARALGLAWAGVDPGDRRLEMTVTTPDEVAPRGPLGAAVRIANLTPGETAYVTIAAVDVGILNLTGFETPAPDAHYFGQRALGMEMRDLYGRLIDGMQGVRGHLRSGGDAAAARLNAPPPTEELVAYFSGVVTVGPDGTATAPFELPDFNGTVRIMAMAWTATAVGHAAKDVLVRDPVVVTVAMPRFLAPGDRSRILLDVVHAKGPTGEVTIGFEGDGGITFPEDAATSTVALTEGELRRVGLPVTAVEVGDPRITVRTVTPAGEMLVKRLTLPVRLNDPAIARRSRIPLAAGGRLVIDSDTFAGFQPGTARATLASGTIAAFDAPGLLMELDRYPYGCTEQLTSRALPLLYVGRVANALGIGVGKDLDERISGAIARVLENQTGAGSFGLWRPGRGDLWLDAYVTDFLSRARAEGHQVPQTAFRAALDNLSSEISYAGDFQAGGEAIAYALMVLAREGQASIGDLRYYADAKAEALATPMAKAQLGAALASYGEQARADRMFRLAAEQVLARTVRDLGWRADYGSHLRDAAAVLALAAEARSEAISTGALTQTIVDSERRHTSTQEKVWMLLAASAALDQTAEGLLVNGAPPDGPVVRAILPGDVANATITIENTGSDTDLVLTTMGVPVAPEPAGGNGYRISRAYYSLDGEPVSPAEVAQNSRLVAVITIEAEDRRRARLIVDDPLPAGFEIDNPNLLQAGAIDALDWLTTSDEIRTTEFRSDRFLAAVDHEGGGRLNLAYIVRAVSPGRFHHPAAIVEDMYRPEFRAWTDTGAVLVVGAR